MPALGTQSSLESVTLQQNLPSNVLQWELSSGHLVSWLENYGGQAALLCRRGEGRDLCQKQIEGYAGRKICYIRGKCYFKDFIHILTTLLKLKHRNSRLKKDSFRKTVLFLSPLRDSVARFLEIFFLLKRFDLGNI